MLVFQDSVWAATLLVGARDWLLRQWFDSTLGAISNDMWNRARLAYMFYPVPLKVTTFLTLSNTFLFWRCFFLQEVHLVMPWDHHVCGMWWLPLLSTSPGLPPLSLLCKVCKGRQRVCFVCFSNHTLTTVVSSSPTESEYSHLCSFRLLRFCLWMAFWLIQISVCISRVFFATHFPHQVIFGLLAGKFFFIAITNLLSWCYDTCHNGLCSQ